VSLTIAIVTDSTSDISPKLAGEHDIYVVPAILVVNGKSLQDGSDISRDELYQQLPTMKVSPTTAAPSIGAFQQAYESLLKKGANQVVSIHASSTLSSMFNTALLAAKAVGKQVHVIDSRQVTLGLGFQVLAAAQAARAGQTLAEIQQAVLDIRNRIHLIAMLDTLEYAYRSGRISWARSNLGDLFRIKPFVGVVDGNVIRMGEARTRQKGIERLYKLLSELGTLEYLAVLHTNAETDALQVVEHFKSVVKTNPLIINVTSLIGVHVGPNGLGFVAVTA
jgi:fatty acid kinase fatty acid binding subunit